MNAFTPSKILVGLVVAAFVLAGGASAFAQNGPAPTFSIDLASPTVGTPDSFYGSPITAGDVLSGPVGGPTIGSPSLPTASAPGLVVYGGAGFPPLGPRALFQIQGQGASAELDALSYGRDLGQSIVFSVDGFAVGNGALPAIPNVASEGAAGAMEASADVYRDIGKLLPLGLAGALPPGLPGAVAGNTMVYDGNATASPAVPPLGLALVEFPPLSDNLDALDIDTVAADAQGPIYYSLDSGFIDPATGAANSNSAVANGFVGGDVIVDAGMGPALYAAAANGFVGGDVLVDAGMGPAVYAAAAALGLDSGGLFADSDDLDALILNDNGDMEFDPANDLLLYSVRRGSAIINTLDSIWGAPIEEGDLLAPPAIGGAAPGIIIPAEWLGLATARTFGVNFGDDLVAADLVPEPATVAMLLSAALAGLLMWTRRRRNAA